MRFNIYWSIVFEQARGSMGQEASCTAFQGVGVLSYSCKSLSKGHSMAMRCSPNSWASARTVVIKLLMNYGPFFRSFMFSKL